MTAAERGMQAQQIKQTCAGLPESKEREAVLDVVSMLGSTDANNKAACNTVRREGS